MGVLLRTLTATIEGVIHRVVLICGYRPLFLC